MFHPVETPLRLQSHPWHAQPKSTSPKEQGSYCRGSKPRPPRPRAQLRKSIAASQSPSARKEGIIADYRADNAVCEWRKPETNSCGRVGWGSAEVLNSTARLCRQATYCRPVYSALPSSFVESSGMIWNWAEGAFRLYDAILRFIRSIFSRRSCKTRYRASGCEQDAFCSEGAFWCPAVQETIWRRNSSIATRSSFRSSIHSN